MHTSYSSVTLEITLFINNSKIVPRSLTTFIVLQLFHRTLIKFPVLAMTKYMKSWSLTVESRDHLLFVQKVQRPVDGNHLFTIIEMKILSKEEYRDLVVVIGTLSAVVLVFLVSGVALVVHRSRCIRRLRQRMAGGACRARAVAGEAEGERQPLVQQ